jgi:hypothetical protein
MIGVGGVEGNPLRLAALGTSPAGAGEVWKAMIRTAG